MGRSGNPHIPCEIILRLGLHSRVQRLLCAEQDLLLPLLYYPMQSREYLSSYPLRRIAVVTDHYLIVVAKRGENGLKRLYTCAHHLVFDLNIRLIFFSIAGELNPDLILCPENLRQTSEKVMCRFAFQMTLGFPLSSPPRARYKIGQDNQTETDHQQHTYI
eukprot:gene12448-8536_t